MNDKIFIQREKDAELFRLRWQKLEADLTSEMGEARARGIVEALRELYSIYSPGIVDWFAGLYDPQIGGFYFSNSARDNDGFLPDVESTRFSLGSFRRLGITGQFGENIASALPPSVKNKIGAFIKGLQDPNGYFYHPQWGKAETDAKPHRRGRDLTMATSALEWLGMKPTYDTPNGVKGDGLLADGTPSPLLSRGEVYNSSGEAIAADPMLKNKESFLEYLSGFEIDLDNPNSSYEIGSDFESQSGRIAARDRELEAAGADYRFADILADWFAKYQDPETGIFCNPEHLDVRAINGVLKIASTYDRLGKPFPNAVNAFRSARDTIISDEEPNTVCWVLNPWYSLTIIMNNVARMSKDSGDASAQKKIAELRDEMIRNYPDMIRATAKKLVKFRKPDGSFSYLQNRTSHIANDMPIAVYGTNEGDVDATNICCGGILGHIFAILNQEMIPFFGEADRLRFIAIIEEKERNNDEK